MKRILLRALYIAVLMVGATLFIGVPNAQAVNPGSWQVLGNCSPNGYKVNAIHASLTRTGKVLLTAGSGYNGSYFTMKIYKAWVWDPATPSTCPVEVQMPADRDIFCAGHAHLPDGQILFFGGTSRYGAAGSSPGTANYYGGIRESYIFDDVALKFVPTGLMSKARWYPSGTVNAAGETVVVGGINEKSVNVTTNEQYSSVTGTWKTLPGTRLFPMYPGMTLRNNGSICYVGTYFVTRAGVNPQCWYPLSNKSVAITGMQLPDCRDQASGVMMPPAQSQRYLVIGGGCKSGTTGTTAIANLASPPKFTRGPYLGYSVMYTCADVLPDWSIFVSGGAAGRNVSPQLKARRLAYGGTAWETMASPTVPRMYHSSCLLMPDGTVVTMGTNAAPGQVEARFEVYRPWYAQPGVARPVITSAASTMQLGGSYQISYTGAAIKNAALIRLGSVTHSSDPNMRLVQLAVSSTGPGTAILNVESNGNVLPLGVYMLSITDTSGVPSTANMVRIVKSAPTQATQSAAPQPSVEAHSSHIH